MEEKYERKLTFSESNRHYIYITKNYRDIFPPAGKEFMIVIDNRKFEAKVGKQNNRIWAANFRDYIDMSEGITLVLSKNPDGSFTLKTRK